MATKLTTKAQREKIRERASRYAHGILLHGDGESTSQREALANAWHRGYVAALSDAARVLREAADPGAQP